MDSHKKNGGANMPNSSPNSADGYPNSADEYPAIHMHVWLVELICHLLANAVMCCKFVGKRGLPLVICWQTLFAI